MEDIKKAQHIINIMTDNNYLDRGAEVISIELNKDNNVNITFVYNDTEEFENFTIPIEIWKLDSDEIIKSYVDLLIAAEEEQNKRTFYEVIPNICQKYLDYLEFKIKDKGMYSNCYEDLLWYKGQLELIREIKKHIV